MIYAIFNNVCPKEIQKGFYVSNHIPEIKKISPSETEACQEKQKVRIVNN